MQLKVSHFCVYILLFMLPSVIIGQTEYERIIITDSWEMPSFIHINTEETDVYANLSHRQYQHPFQNVYQSTFHLKYSAKQLDISTKFNSEHEGAFIRKNRLYGSLGTRVQLNETFTAGAGLSFGFQSLAYDSQTDALSAGSTKPDGSIGLGVFSNRLVLYTSLNHIFQNSLQPADIELQLKRYINLYISVKTVETEHYNNRFFYYQQILTNQKNLWWCGFDNTFYKRFSLGGGISNRKAFIIRTGISIMHETDFPVMLVFAYEDNYSKGNGYVLPSFHLGGILHFSR